MYVVRFGGPSPHALHFRRPHLLGRGAIPPAARIYHLQRMKQCDHVTVIIMRHHRQSPGSSLRRLKFSSDAISRLLLVKVYVAFTLCSMSDTANVVAVSSSLPTGGDADRHRDRLPAGDPPLLGNFSGDGFETPAPNNSKRARLECCTDGSGSASSSSLPSADEVSLSPDDGPLFGLTLSQEHCKRKDYLSWQEYFFATALLSSLRSKDPYHPSGACLVDKENRIVGIGYNGFPSGFPDDELSFQSADASPWMESREPFCIPAEVNCLLNSPVKTSRGTTMYCVHFPNHDCAKFIVQSRRVAKVVYGRFPEEPSDSVRVSQVLLQQAGIVVEPYRLARPVELAFMDSTGPSSTGRSESAPSHLSWDEYFMAIALLTARRSKDPNTQVGACIVSPRRRIIACGYNGFTVGCSDDTFPWQRSAPDPKHTKYMWVAHAELNAIVNCYAPQAEQDGATLYVTLFPCYQCAQAIVQAGIRRVVYLSDPYRDDEKFRASRRIFDVARVDYQAFQPRRASVALPSETPEKATSLRSPLTNDESSTPPTGGEQQ